MSRLDIFAPVFVGASCTQYVSWSSLSRASRLVWAPHTKTSACCCGVSSSIQTGASQNTLLARCSPCDTTLRRTHRSRSGSPCTWRVCCGGSKRHRRPSHFYRQIQLWTPPGGGGAATRRGSVSTFGIVSNCCWKLFTLYFYYSRRGHLIHFSVEFISSRIEYHRSIDKGRP